MKKKNEQHYVDNVDFHKTLVEYSVICNKLGIIKDNNFKYPKRSSDNATTLDILEELKNKLGKIFMRICDGVLMKPNFINYSQDRKEEMKSDACWFFSKYVMKFDITKKNPFSYFTTMAFHAFLQYINRKNKYTEKFSSLEYIENIHSANNLENDWIDKDDE